MLSCDTIAVLGKCSANGQNTLMKNSDRPMGEAQPLLFVPGKKYAEGETVQTTNLVIPQAEETYATLGAHPYWIYGYEMGVNEYGVVIANEAEGSRAPKEAEEGLLGMDLLRLGLERGKTAEEAMGVIISLLEKYGQNANASLLFERRYENSFMIMDREEIWLLETAGRRYAAKKAEETAVISNCYTIGSSFDRASADLEDYARSMRFLSPKAPFDFARAYTKGAARQRAAVPRWRILRTMAEDLMAENGGVLSEEDLTYMFRNHFEERLIAPRFGAMSGTFATVCMHAFDMRESRTVSSMYFSYDTDGRPLIRYAAGYPCTSAYLPVFFTENLPECLLLGKERYDKNSLWWQMERLGTDVSVDEVRYGEVTRVVLARIEDAARKETEGLTGAEPPEAREEIMRRYADKLMDRVTQMAEQIEADIRKNGGTSGPLKELVDEYAVKTGLPLAGGA